MANTRTLSEISRDITANWPNPYFGAVPYIQAMRGMGDINSSIGLDDGKYVVAYFLSNAGTWRGEHARRIKSELKAMIGRK